MIRKLLQIIAVILIFSAIFFIVGTSWKQFKSDIELKKPTEVFHVDLPEIEEDNPDIPKIEEDSISVPSIENDSVDIPKIDVEFSKTEDSKIEDNKIEVKQEEKKEDKKDNVSESSTGISEDELDSLIKSIRVADKENTEYNRDDWEKPAKKYKFNGQSLSRNKYAWHISTYLNSEEPFSYTCPYTGIEITDPSKLDFDHIVPLKYTYTYCPDTWTKEDYNKYAYDQLIGIDVLNKANRSKGAKGPSDWLPDVNKSSYCYTFLTICSKYDIAMPQIDIDVCKLEILNDMENAVLLNTFIEESEEYKLQQDWEK